MLSHTRKIKFFNIVTSVSYKKRRLDLLKQIIRPRFDASIVLLKISNSLVRDSINCHELTKDSAAGNKVQNI